MLRQSGSRRDLHQVRPTRSKQECAKGEIFSDSYNSSSLVINTLCDEAGVGGEGISEACFYFDFTVQKELSAGTFWVLS